MTQIQQQMKELHTEVFRETYYNDIYWNCLAKHRMTHSGIVLGEYSDAKIIDMCNDFWLDLPDSAAIRRNPFFLLCDIAEHCF